MCVFFPGYWHNATLSGGKFRGCQICTWVGNLSVGAAAGICSRSRWPEEPWIGAAAVTRDSAEELDPGNDGMVTALSATWGILLALGLVIDFGGFLTWKIKMKKLRQAALANPANMLNGSVQKLRLKVIELSLEGLDSMGQGFTYMAMEGYFH
jgi:hypothetical protein